MADITQITQSVAINKFLFGGGKPVTDAIAILPEINNEIKAI